MRPLRRSGFGLLLVLVCATATACHLRRPETTPSRMVEPQLLDPQLTAPTNQAPKDANPAPIRLLDTQARGHIGRRVLHQQPNGELTEDAVWRWSSAPDRYLDTALRIEVESRPDLRLVDTSDAPVLGATLLEWNLQSSGTRQLVGAVEFQTIGNDRVVHTDVVRATEPVSAELPGDLAAAAGRLLRRLASDGLKGAGKEQSKP